jgi:hypothetical protein
VVYLDGIETTTAEMLEIARSLAFANDLSQVTLGAAAVPDGLQFAHAAEVTTAPEVATEFKFERNGALFQVDLYPGGRETVERRLDGSTRTVTVRGQRAALTTIGGNHFKLLFADGRWAAEFSGGPFADEQAFLDTVDSLTVIPNP